MVYRGTFQLGCSRRKLPTGLDKAPELPSMHHKYRQPMIVMITFTVKPKNSNSFSKLIGVVSPTQPVLAPTPPYLNSATVHFYGCFFDRTLNYGMNNVNFPCELLLPLGLKS